MNNQPFGFNDEGHLEPVTVPAGPSDADLAAELLETLRVIPSPEALTAAEEFVERVAWSRAAEALNEILNRLDDTAAGAALRRAICGDGGLTLRDEAERLGCSHVAVYKQAVRVRERLEG